MCTTKQITEVYLFENDDNHDGHYVVSLSIGYEYVCENEYDSGQGRIDINEFLAWMESKGFAPKEMWSLVEDDNPLIYPLVHEFVFELKFSQS